MKGVISDMFVPILDCQTTLNDDPELVGVGLTIFCAGCNHHCEGCHSMATWDKENGKLTDINILKNKIDSAKSLISYVCFCGGDFMLYPEQLEILAKHCKEKELRTILYTGFLFEDISENIRQNMDIIVDGKFELDAEQISFPASKNQRVWIDGIVTDPDTLAINRRN